MKKIKKVQTGKNLGIRIVKQECHSALGNNFSSTNGFGTIIKQNGATIAEIAMLIYGQISVKTFIMERSIQPTTFQIQIEFSRSRT